METLIPMPFKSGARRFRPVRTEFRSGVGLLAPPEQLTNFLANLYILAVKNNS